MAKYSSLMNKLFILLMATTLCCGLASCSKDDDDNYIGNNNSSSSDNGSNSSNGNSSYMDDVIGTWVDISDVNDVASKMAEANLYTLQGRLDKVATVAFKYSYSIRVYIITKSTIQERRIVLNKSGQRPDSTAKELLYYKGNYYYLSEERDSPNPIISMGYNYIELNAAGTDWFTIHRRDDGSVSGINDHLVPFEWAISGNIIHDDDRNCGPCEEFEHDCYLAKFKKLLIELLYQ